MADDATTPPAARSRRGFAAMDPEKRRIIAARGGKAIPAHLRSFAQNRDLASTAGAKGGAASHGGGRKPGTKNLHE